MFDHSGRRNLQQMRRDLAQASESISQINQSMNEIANQVEQLSKQVTPRNELQATFTSVLEINIKQVNERVAAVQDGVNLIVKTSQQSAERIEAKYVHTLVHQFIDKTQLIKPLLCGVQSGGNCQPQADRVVGASASRHSQMHRDHPRNTDWTGTHECRTTGNVAT